MYKIILTEKAKQQLSSFSRDIQHRIGAVIERLKIRPIHISKRLIGSPLFRARAGDYRIIFEIREKELIIYVLEIGHRKKIYK